MIRQEDLKVAPAMMYRLKVHGILLSCVEGFMEVHNQLTPHARYTHSGPVNFVLRRLIVPKSTLILLKSHC